MLKKLKLFLLLIMISFLGNKVSADYDKLAYDFKFKDLDGSALSLSEYKGKVIVVVNVASQCGFTNQYEDMQKIWEKYQKKGVVMLGVPSNDFGNQEPADNEDIRQFCDAKYSISFPLAEKCVVTGKNAHPFFIWARQELGFVSGAPRWNFHKILIDKNGNAVTGYTALTKPGSKKFRKKIENLLAL